MNFARALQEFAEQNRLELKARRVSDAAEQAAGKQDKRIQREVGHVLDALLKNVEKTVKLNERQEAKDAKERAKADALLERERAKEERERAKEGKEEEKIVAEVQRVLDRVMARLEKEEEREAKEAAKAKARLDAKVRTPSPYPLTPKTLGP